MIKIKKIMGLLGIFLLVICLLGVELSYASTVGTVYLTTNVSTLEKQEEVELTIALKDSKTAAFNINLYFDDTKLEYVSGPDNTNVVGNCILFVWYDTNGGNDAKEGELASFIFKAKEDGIANFSIDGEFYSQVGQKIQTEFEQAQVQIGKEETALEKEAKEEKGSNTQASNANLQALRINQEGVVPNFDKNTHEYYLTVSNTINEIEVLAISENPNATVEISGNTNLKEGLNSIKIQVISEDKTQKNTYTIEATKTANLELANTNLETLAIENTLLNPPFDNTVTSYTTQVSNSIIDLNILAVPENEKAKVEIRGKNELKEGDNKVTIIVTAPNGFTKKEYDINVYKRNVQEEKQYEQEQLKMQQELEETYKMEQTSNSQENLDKPEQNKQSMTGIVVIGGVIVFALIVAIIIGYRKKKGIRVEK